MTQRNIAIWTAVSTKEQAKLYSLDNQLAETRAFVESIPARYGDTAKIVAEISMADTRSIIEFSEAVALYPQSYGILEKLIKSQRINVLVCLRRDRLGREDSLIMTIEALCRKNKIKLVALASNIPATLDPIDDEGSGYLVAVEAVTARVEVKRLQVRRESGMRGRVTDLLLFPGRRPWGYSYLYKPNGEIDQIVMDTEIKQIVRRILVDLYLYHGYGVPRIRDILNAEGIRSPRGKIWHVGGVRSIIERADRYAGWLEWNEKSKLGSEHVRVRGDYEPMITEAEYEAINAEFENRQYSQQRRHNILSGIVYCAGCNQKMFHNIRYRYLKTRTTWHYELRCTSPHCSASTTVRVPQVIALIEESFALIASLTDEELIKMVEEKPVDVMPVKARLIGLEAENVKLQEERKRAIYAFVTLQAITASELEEQLSRIENRLAVVTSEIASTEIRIHEIMSHNEASLRLKAVKEVGKTMLDLRHDNPALANQWFRRHIVIMVYKAGTADKRLLLRVI